MKTLGVCIGASTVSAVVLEVTDKNQIKELCRKKVFHDGDSKKGFQDILKDIDISTIDRVAVTGRKFKNFVNLTTITEPEAVECAAKVLIKDNSDYEALVSAGGETILVYQIDKDGKIKNVFTGNKCASGTGAFFLQQLGRMALTIDDVIDKEFNADNAYNISGRCSVFCKSDCTHALNKGIEKTHVVDGLCKMMAAKITELLTSLERKNIVLTGGISKVRPIVECVRQSVDKLYIPDASDCFEAYGAAVWAADHETKKFPAENELFKKDVSSFDFLRPLTEAEHLVEFKKPQRGTAKEGDVCILGVDIGSTTTKAVLMRKSDDAILADCYLRTNGDPIGAAKECYRAIEKQLNGTNVKIVGMGTTGSGRHIVGIHAMTQAIYNEIICHATASVYFDPDVDTIFEIGGQDAKYTYVTQGIPSDYAMNEACSAGTGSFLEEAAKEALNIDIPQIVGMAFASTQPPNFNDQCSAFISSDIATALQEGIDKNDIVAGLVYSICLNYNNRVRGARPYGKKIFMQGGVCRDKAVPTAMASLLNTKIIVPPDPGLMGAFGCAYEVKKRLDKHFLEEKEFNLKTLYTREIKYLPSFTCAGGKEKCDRKCQINMMELEGEKIPFGGACNKYYNMRLNVEYDAQKLDLVAVREKMLFEEFAKPCGLANENSKVIGINRTFLTNMLYPLYFNFWDQLGYKVILSDSVTIEGREKRKAAFCYPAEIAHGAFDDLLKRKPDYIFMPHIMHIPVHGDAENNKACVFVQGEPYYLKQAFKDVEIPEMLIPIVDFQGHVQSTCDEFVKIAESIGVNHKAAVDAFKFAEENMNAYFAKARKLGQEAIDDLKRNPDDFAVVLQGRWYNALAREANMGIPHKIASRGIKVIPYDFIPFETQDLGLHMHWGIGKIALQIAKYVKANPQLFSTYVTNFSCGPDSFLVPYFRDEMGKKPSLTLELDSHTADVGLDTRIEAALDIIRYYRQLEATGAVKDDEKFQAAEIVQKGTKVWLKDSKGKLWDIKHPDVTFLFPIMGRYLTEGGVNALRKDGYHADMVDYPDVESLGIGKANSGCKECLPYIVLAGSLMKYIKTRRRPGEKIAFFIVGDPAPCRVEQYQVGFKKLLEKNHIEDVAILTLQSDKGFAGMGLLPLLNVWKAFIVGDVFEQIHSAVMTLSKDRAKGLEIFEVEWAKILKSLSGESKVSLMKQLKSTAAELEKIELTKNIRNANRVTITGEMYVRNEQFSRQDIENTLADMGFVAKITPLIEWLYYVDYTQMKNYGNVKFTLGERIFFFFKRKIQHGIEKDIKKVFAKSSLYEYDPIDIAETMETANPLVNPKLIGDIGLTIAGGLKESLQESCGVISLGPFACLQTRMAEAILKNNMTVGGKRAVTNRSVFGDSLKDLPDDMPLPYLAIESDGNPYPQIIRAQLEVFGLQAKRVGEMMQNARAMNNNKK